MVFSCNLNHHPLFRLSIPKNDKRHLSQCQMSLASLDTFGDFALCFSDSLRTSAMTTMNPTLSNQLDRSWADRLVPSLNRLLADFEMLRFNARSALWNGWGEQYPAMTDMLPAFVQHAETATKHRASRIRCSGIRPVSTMAECLELSTLKCH